MIPIKIRNEIISGLNRINSMNSVKFMVRFRENLIYLDLNETMITSNYCRIEYLEEKDFLFVQFYNLEQSLFEPEKVRFKKDIIKDNLELLFVKHASFQ